MAPERSYDDDTPKLAHPVVPDKPSLESRIAVWVDRQLGLEARVRSLERDRRWLGVAALTALASLAWQALREWGRS